MCAMDSLHELAKLFEKFPGIGPRQAQRFVHYLLKSPPIVRTELAEHIAALTKKVHQCSDCLRFHEGEKGVCIRCGKDRDQNLLMIVAHDTDAEAVERARTYQGTYFILGGTVILGAEKQNHLRERELKMLIKKKATTLQEVICALPANPEGDTTAQRIKDVVLETMPTLKITTLGRGLSTGSELEYADNETIKSAVLRRS